MLSISAASGRRAIAQSFSRQYPKLNILKSATNSILQHQHQHQHQYRHLSSSNLPDHEVVGMPALSPTMEAGTISSWKVNEGESFAAGDSIAEIETDKASIDFEAQDDGVVAKILKQAGGGEINVGEPIVVIVEEEDDVAAFKDFVVDDSNADTGTAAAAPVATEEVISSVPECKFHNDRMKGIYKY
jgi:biotin carboxyl carrier protein